MSYGLIVTTASNIEGYRIIEYLDMVFGEIAVHGANIQEKGVVGTWGKAMASWGASTEYGNQTKVVRSARSEAYNQITNEARKLGANAIIGIHTDNTITGDLVFVSMYGTAVKTKPVENDKESVQWQRRTAIQQNKEVDTHRSGETIEIKKSDDHEKKEEFLKTMWEVDTALKIWQIWSKSGLDEDYRTLNDQIVHAMHNERSYGTIAKDINRLKMQIEEALLGVKS